MNNINGLTYVINDPLNYTVKFPNNLLGSSTHDITSIISIVWKVSPKHPDPNDDYDVASPFVSLFLVEDNQEVSLINPL